MRELAGWSSAAAIALVTAGQVASSARADLVFRDGDSLVVALFSRSLLSGDALDWAMSSVLFLPETAGYSALDLALPLGVNAILAVSAVLNLLALYGAIRVAAGRAGGGRAPVAWSVIALGVFGILAMTDVSASRDALDLASLQLTTTYYSSIVVAVVLSIGLARRILDRGERGERGGRTVALLITLGLVSTVATLSNPLFAVWATITVVAVLAILALRATPRAPILTMLVPLLGGTALGIVLRIPFAPWIANTGVGYAQPALWAESLQYYGRLLTERLQHPLGALGAILVVALLVLAIVQTRRAEDTGSRLVAVVAWSAPLIVVVGAIALGTHAARYLQPVAFVPLLALVASPRVVHISARVRSRVAAGVAVLLLVGGALSIPRLSDAASKPDVDLACVTDWVDDSGRTGAGQFWTVRLPKLHLADPSHLVQVDHQLNGYAWLVNRTDFDVGEVSFLVEDSQTVQWDLPVAVVPDEVVDCGRYSILDFGEQALPLGPQRS